MQTGKEEVEPPSWQREKYRREPRCQGKDALPNHPGVAGLGQKQAVIDKHGRKTCERRNIEYAALTITKQF